MRRLRPIQALLAASLLTTVTSCDLLDDVLSPGRRDPNAQPAREALAAQLPAISRSRTTGNAMHVRVQAYYTRSDGTLVLLTTVSAPLIDAPTQQVPVTINLSPCLTDPLRGAPSQTGRAAACQVSLVIALVDGETVVDQQAVGPLRLLPGVSENLAEPVRLFELASVEVTPNGGTPSGGALRVEIGSRIPLATIVRTVSGQPVDGRTIEWATDAPSVASVDVESGALVGMGLGRAHISALVGAARGALDVKVVPRPSAIAVAAMTGSGSGWVRSSPEGIACRLTPALLSPSVAGGSACTFTFPGDAQVTLTATPDASARFDGWGGACAAIAVGTTCVVDASQVRSVTVGFTAMRAIALASAGTGKGAITSTPNGLTCGVAGASGCEGRFPDGTTVTLTAAAEASHVFVGWGGACTGASGRTCTLTLRGDVAVTSRFEAPSGVSVELSGTGGGDVLLASDESGPLVCERQPGMPDASCMISVPFGSEVTLTARPDAASEFTGWTGACSGTASCRVTAQGGSTIGATFSARQASLTLTLGGAGAGSLLVDGRVTCSHAGGVRSTTCRSAVFIGSIVTLTTSPAAGASFDGWTGDVCNGTTANRCSFAASGDVSVGATFGPSLATLTVHAISGLASTGTGRITSEPAGIDCTLTAVAATGACSAPFARDARVTLTATAPNGSAFAAWGDACQAFTGTTCTLTPSGPVSVGAQFASERRLLTVTMDGAGMGTVTSSPGGILCRLTCTASFASGTYVTLSAAPEKSSAFAGWSGAGLASCTGVGTCKVPMDRARNVVATFIPR